MHVPFLQSLAVLLNRQLIATNDLLPGSFLLALLVTDLKESLEAISWCTHLRVPPGFLDFLAPRPRAASRSATRAIHLSYNGLFSICVNSDPP